MKKVQVGFKFSPEADARLKDLARVGGQTRTMVLEGLIAGADMPGQQKASAKKDRDERLVERAQAAPKPLVSETVRRQVISKPDWKEE